MHGEFLTTDNEAPGDLGQYSILSLSEARNRSSGPPLDDLFLASCSDDVLIGVLRYVRSPNLAENEARSDQGWQLSTIAVLSAVGSMCLAHRPVFKVSRDFGNSRWPTLHHPICHGSKSLQEALNMLLKLVVRVDLYDRENSNSRPQPSPF